MKMKKKKYIDYKELLKLRNNLFKEWEDTFEAVKLQNFKD